AFTFGVAFARGPRPPRLLVAFLREIAAGIFLIPVWPLFAVLGRRWAARAVAASTGERAGGAPVVLVHGYLMNRTNWLWFGRALARRGIGPLTGFGYLTLGRLENAAAQLGAHVEKVCAAEGTERVDLVAHSMGGLVARYYIEKLGGAKRVRRL